MKTTRLKVTLLDVEPTVTRVIDVPAAITLGELHEVLQVALGWTNSHLHQFRTEDAVYSLPFPDWEPQPGDLDERGVRLSAMPRVSVMSTTLATAGTTKSRSSARAATRLGA